MSPAIVKMIMTFVMSVISAGKPELAEIICLRGDPMGVCWAEVDVYGQEKCATWRTSEGSVTVCHE